MTPLVSWAIDSELIWAQGIIIIVSNDIIIFRLQCSYSSLSFLKVLWPEFSVWDFYGAIISFQWNYKTYKVRIIDRMTFKE